MVLVNHEDENEMKPADKKADQKPRKTADSSNMPVFIILLLLFWAISSAFFACIWTYHENRLKAIHKSDLALLQSKLDNKTTEFDRLTGEFDRLTDLLQNRSALASKLTLSVENLTLENAALRDKVKTVQVRSFDLRLDCFTELEKERNKPHFIVEFFLRLNEALIHGLKEFVRVILSQ